MEYNYWIDFWRGHGEKTKESNEQVQVLRTINKQPIDPQKWDLTIQHIKEQLEIKKDDDVLELCSGNGLITKALSPLCKSVVAVDVSEDLLAGISAAGYSNVETVCSDIRKLDLQDRTFSKIIIYAGLQYFTYAETVALFENMYKWLRPGGILYIGDIPDTEKLWTFFNTPERETVYFNTVKEEKDIIGTWFERTWLEKLSKFTGYKKSVVVEQRDFMICSFFRYDMKLIK